MPESTQININHLRVLLNFTEAAFNEGYFFFEDFEKEAVYTILRLNYQLAEEYPELYEYVRPQDIK